MANISIDHFGSFTVFGFGGFASLGSGLAFCYRENNETREKQLVTSEFSSPFSIIGTLIIFLIVPILAFEGDGSMQRESFTNFTTAFGILLSMSSAITSGIAFSCFTNGYLRIRDVQNSLIAGIVVGGSSSYYVTNPGFSILMGGVGAILQILFEYLIEKPLFVNFGVHCTYPSSMFSLQSLVCFLMSALFSDWTDVLRDGFTYTTLQSTANIVAVCFISMGIGFATGVVCGIIFIFILPDDPPINFDDEEFWNKDDGIRNIRQPFTKGGKEKYAP